MRRNKAKKAEPSKTMWRIDYYPKRTPQQVVVVRERGDYVDINFGGTIGQINRKATPLFRTKRAAILEIRRNEVQDAASRVRWIKEHIRETAGSLERHKRRLVKAEHRLMKATCRLAALKRK